MRYSDKFLESRWSELEDVPFDETSDGYLVLAENFWIFPKGTEREEIWHFFDEHHSKGIIYLLYEWNPTRLICCHSCYGAYDESEMREVVTKWQWGKPVETVQLCRFCVSEMENDGRLTRCENCGEVFSPSGLLKSKVSGEKELCPYCGDVWCE